MKCTCRSSIWAIESNEDARAIDTLFGSLSFKYQRRVCNPPARPKTPFTYNTGLSHDSLQYSQHKSKKKSMHVTCHNSQHKSKKKKK